MVTRTRRLVLGDNIDAMASMQTNSVRLVYLDPPFCSGRDYEFVSQSSTGERNRRAFTDRWLDGSDERWRVESKVLPSAVKTVVDTIAKAFPQKDITGYLHMMAPRLAEAHRLLDDAGSLYLHCDPTAGHYLKVVLDAIFGRENFRSEVVWKRTHAHSSARRYGPVHDTILFYSKSPRYRWHPQFTEYSQGYLDQYYTREDDNGPYQLITCTAPGERIGTRAHYEWRGLLPPPGRHWAWTEEQMEQFEREGRLVYSSNGIPRLRRYLHEGSGVAIQDVWSDINRLDAHSSERVGFETQKPISLLERIVSASTDIGDPILDPFCGSGTTLVAAERQKRDWIGIDSSGFAVGIALGRVRQDVGAKAVELIGFPTTESDAKRLIKSDPVGFGVWAASMLATVPRYQNEESGIVCGIGQIESGRRKQLSIASWVPIRTKYEPRYIDLDSQYKRATAFVVSGHWSVRPLLDWIRRQVQPPLLKEVSIAQLVEPEAVRQGYAVGLTA